MDRLKSVNRESGIVRDLLLTRKIKIIGISGDSSEETLVAILSKI
jgi:hypothetical protein